jgi:hypothetical protein
LILFKVSEEIQKLFPSLPRKIFISYKVNKMRTVCFFLVMFSYFGFAQWSTNPAVNLTICDLTGDQALAKIASVSDGGTYISWFDNRSGNYAVYLQRLDPYGNKMWDSNGLLISSNDQSSSLVDYDLMADQNNNAESGSTGVRECGSAGVGKPLRLKRILHERFSLTPDFSQVIPQN